MQALRRRIFALGAVSRGRYFETNISISKTAGGELVRKKQLLRLRKDHKNTLTFKAEPPDHDDRRFQNPAGA